MPDIVLCAIVHEAARARALALAVERLARGPLSVEVHGGRRHAQHPRRESLTPADACRLIGEAYDSESEIVVDFGAFAVTCRGADVVGGGQFRTILSAGAFSETSRPDVVLPRAVSARDVVAARQALWARDVEHIVAGLTGAGSPADFTRLYAGEEETFGSPFAAYAVAHATYTSLALDIARGWLSAHGHAPYDVLADEPSEELRRRVDAARVAERAARATDAPHSYDGSLTGEQVLRIFEMPISEAEAAFKAVCAPTSEARELFEIGDTLLAAVANGAATMSAPHGSKRVPYIPRLRTAHNGAILLHAGPFQRLWPVYRDVAALLLGETPLRPAGLPG